MQTPVHNKELISAVEDLRKRKIIRQDNDIVEKTGYSKSTVSGYISGNVKASSKFINEFENQFKIRLIDYADSANGQQKPSDPLTGAHVTLQDYITLLKDYNEKLFYLLSSNLGNLKEGQRTMIAYQKAWVDYAAELESKGDPDKKAEIRYKMNKSVDDILSNDSLSDIQVGSGKRGKG
jgi:hypothetical protein